MGAKERGKSFFGCALASDESPPESNRYTGLRFQITWLYVPFFPPHVTWENTAYDNDYPIHVKKFCCDIMNADSKTGRATFSIICRQLARFGLSEYDVVAGVGDGGGENEGTQGVHSQFEELEPSYVRRRCAPHFAWRTFDAGAQAMGEVYKRTIALNSYLRDGVTWSRLAAIAVQDPEENGLGLFIEGSQAFADVFSSSPPRLIDERPQATLDFYRWLVKREPVLRRLISHDMRLRGLGGSDAQQALATITSNEDWARRRVDVVLFQKAMYMFLLMKKHCHTVAADLSFEELIDNASDIVTSTECTDEVLDILGLQGTGMIRLPYDWLQLLRNDTTVAISIAS